MLTVYSKTNCQYCEAITKLLKLKNIEYKKLLLAVDFTREEFIEKFGSNTTFPKVLKKDGTIIGGDTETVNYLKAEDLL